MGIRPAPRVEAIDPTLPARAVEAYQRLGSARAVADELNVCRATAVRLLTDQGIKMWRPERTAKCGTDSGYYRHKRAGEDVCDRCREAHRAAELDYAERKRRGIVRTCLRDGCDGVPDGRAKYCPACRAPQISARQLCACGRVVKGDRAECLPCIDAREIEEEGQRVRWYQDGLVMRGWVDSETS